MGEPGYDWLGLEQTADHQWLLPVVDGLVSGAGALFGGCATAAGLVAVRSIVPQPVLWAGAHFGSLAPRGTDVLLDARVISSGRTMSHVEVVGTVDGRESFTVRVAAGERPAGNAEGRWVERPAVAGPDDCMPFEHPVHVDTWAARFEWRLAELGVASGAPPAPVAAWWVRPRPGERHDPLVSATVLVDYVTYGVGRALAVPMGGLSVDNVVRLHRLPEAEAGWWLLEVRPEAIAGGFGHGTARVYAGDELIATGSQTIVVNTWDWRLPAERA